MSFFGSDDVRWLGEARVGWSELESLASPDDGQAVALVCTWRRSMRRALVAAALETCADSADCAVRVLGMAEDADAAAVAAVLDTPSVGLWARRCLRVGRLSVHDAGPAEVSYLLGLVAAAAARSGIEFELPVPVVDASLFLPTIGTADIDGTTAVVRGGPRELTIAGASTEIDVHSPDPGRTRHWHPVHHLDIRHGHGTLRVAIDDSDPYLTRLAGDEPQRLPARDRADLSVRLQQAWSWLVDNMDGHAHAISAMVQAVVPARRSGGVRSTSASSRAANGAFVVSLSADAHTLARLLVHEVQHMKLSALLDIVPLSNSGAARYRAPWRHDPRPAVALLQGVYAHVGEAAYWERRSRAYAESRRLETFEYQYVTRQAQVAIDTLVDSTDLTDAGRRFVRRLAGTLDLLQESRTATLSHAAQDLMLAREVHWRLANYIPGTRHGQSARLVPGGSGGTGGGDTSGHPRDRAAVAGVERATTRHRVLDRPVRQLARKRRNGAFRPGRTVLHPGRLRRGHPPVRGAPRRRPALLRRMGGSGSRAPEGRPDGRCRDPVASAGPRRRRVRGASAGRTGRPSHRRAVTFRRRGTAGAPGTSSRQGGHRDPCACRVPELGRAT